MKKVYLLVFLLSLVSIPQSHAGPFDFVGDFFGGIFGDGCEDNETEAQCNARKEQEREEKRLRREQRDRERAERRATLRRERQARRAERRQRRNQERDERNRRSEPAPVVTTNDTPEQQLNNYLQGMGYRIGATDAEINRARQILRTGKRNQGNGCGLDEAVSGNMHIGFYDQVIKEETDYILNNYQPECLERLLSLYMSEKLRNPFDPMNNSRNPIPYHCFGTSPVNPDGSIGSWDNVPVICPQLYSLPAEYEEISQRLYNALYLPSQSNRLLCANDTNTANLRGIANFTADLAEVAENANAFSDCEELDVGEARRSSSNQFALRRTNANTLEATLVYNFNQSAEGSQFSASQMHERVATCLSRASQFMRNSDGETINIKVLTPQEATSLPQDIRPETINIDFHDMVDRGNTSLYDNDFSCGTMVHEALHHLGLPDEYHEGGGGYAAERGDGSYHNFVAVNNDCRAISETPSIMRHHNEAIQAILGQEMTCACPPHNSTCRTYQGTPHFAKVLGLRKNWMNPRVTSNPHCRVETELTNTRRVRSEQELLSMQVEPRIQRNNRRQLRISLDLLLTPEGQYSSTNLGSRTTSELICNCPAGDQQCMESLDRLESAPAAAFHETYPVCSKLGMAAVGRANSTIERTAANYLDAIPTTDPVNEMTITDLGDGSFRIRLPSAHDNNGSILHPGQFARLKYGMCPTRAVKFRRCQQYSTVAECPDRPAYCDNDEEWLLAPQ